jgi:hypothetical protein
MQPFFYLQKLKQTELIFKLNKQKLLAGIYRQHLFGKLEGKQPNYE